MLKQITEHEKKEKGNRMKNLTISKKLGVGFGIVLILLVLSTILSLFSINNIGHQVELYGKFTVPNSERLTGMRVNMQGVLFSLLEAITEEDVKYSEEALKTADIRGKEIAVHLDAFRDNSRNNSNVKDIDELSAIITEAAGIRSKIVELVNTHSAEDRSKAIRIFWDEYRPKLDSAIEILDSYDLKAKDEAENQSATANSTTILAYAMLLVCGIVSIVFTVIVIIAIRKSILNPVNEIMDVFEEVARGNMKAEIKYESRDEMGRMAKLIQNSNKMVSQILADVSEKFTGIANGDLCIKVDMEYPGDFAVLKESMRNTVSALNRTMHTINIAAEHVSTGADQVSDGAQALAAGSTEQAASIQELSASIEKVAEQGTENLAVIDTASKSVKHANKAVNDGNQQMEQLTEAMVNIDSSSNQIVEIIKVIEDIASQTNLLALNAAIEAARAGDAGKGFAVVAIEVRDLAAKSAEAAKQTGELIQASVADVSKGKQITTQMELILKDVRLSTQEVTEGFVKIEQASTEQASAIEQIKLGLSQVSAVVQNNAATAEENSATSEEMSAQAATLREEVGKFKLA